MRTLPIRLLAPLVALCALAGHGQAAVHTWTGNGVNTSWGTATNWSGGLPASGGSLVFPAIANKKFNFNNLPFGTSFHTLTLSAAGYQISGNAITLTSALRSTDFGIDSRIDVPINLFGGITFEVADVIDAGGLISGSGLTKIGNGELRLGANNTYLGLTDVRAGILSFSRDGGLGLTNATWVRRNATLAIGSGAVSGERLELFPQDGAATLRAYRTGGTWTGAVSLVDGDAVFDVYAGATMTFTGVIDGIGGFTQVGPGTVHLAGTVANAFAGAVRVGSGTLVLEQAVAHALPGPLTIGDDAAGAAVVRLAASDQIPDLAAVSIASDGRLELAGGSETIGSLAGAGSIDLGGELRCGANGSDSTWGGVLSGVGGLVKIGAGTLVLTGAAANGGVNQVLAGTLAVAGSLPTRVDVIGGTLAGAGSVGGIIVASGAMLAPGGDDVGILGCTGDALLDDGSILAVRLQGTTPGAGHDRLDVAGAIELRGALALTLAYAPTVGDTLVILANDGADAVGGSFAGLAAGATVSAGGADFAITYSGGDGNDVALACTAIAGVRDGTTTVVTSSVQPAVVGQTVVFTATVTPQAGGTPTGAVTFSDGGLVLGAADLDAGAAATWTGILARGDHTITATYAGDTDYVDSASAPLLQSVVQAQSAFDIAASVNPAPSGTDP
ncbi:MAG: Ig-like domain repeat protein, partial [Planctomycetes bacterium]|nr:Ig-like domain repeat protein [Planctomycetota bacterium]